jgi:outer membrane protein TolC
MLPTVAVTASYQQLENTVLDREEFTMMGVGFRWALFDGGQARHRATALRRSSDSVRQRRNELESIVRLEVQQARLGIEAADARVSLTRDAIAEANENLRITRDLYAESLVTNTQVLEAIALQTAAEGQAADAVFDASIARLRLLKAIGEL